MEETSPSTFHKRIYIALGVGLIVIVFLTVFLYLQSRAVKQAVKNANQTSNDSSQSSIGTKSYSSLDEVPAADFEKPIIRKLPQVKFTNYIVQTDLPTVKDEIKVYELKGTFNKTEALNLAKKYGLNGKIIKETPTLIYIKDESNKKNVKFLTYSTVNGDYFLYATDGIDSLSQSKDPMGIAKDFLSKKGILDTTMTVSNYFKRAKTPNLSYVEIHRDWNKLGLPLLNTLGLLNFPEQNRLTTARLGQILPDAPLDSDVIFSLDGQNKKARPDDFNTILATVDNRDGKIVSIASNIKTVNTVKTVGKNDLKTPEEALEDLKNNNNVFTLTLPSGSGPLDIDKVYPQGKASAENANISDFVLVYLSNPQEKKELSYIPYYAFRGVALLDSGYRTQYIQVIPALKNPKVLGAEIALAATPTFIPTAVQPSIGITINPTRANETIQYATVVGITGVPVTVPITGEPDYAPGSQVSCPIFKYQYRVPGGIIAATAEYVNAGGHLIRNWYYIPDNPNEDIDINQFTCKTEEQCGPLGNRGSPREDGKGPAYNGLCGFTTSVCPVIQQFKDTSTKCIYITSASPSIYLYADNITEFSVSINPRSDLTFIDPIFTENSTHTWKGSANKNGNINLADGTLRERLYYEYKKDGFIKEIYKRVDMTKGFIVQRNNLSSFLSKTLATKIKLNNKETNDLIAEVKRETAAVNSEYVQISLVDENTLNTYLPLVVNPVPNHIYRIHLFISPSNKKEINQPNLPIINREGSALVETGVIVKN